MRYVRSLSPILLILLLLASCEPFIISTFPGFLADINAFADLSKEFANLDVEHFEVFAMTNNMDEEYVFVFAHVYNNNPVIIVCDEKFKFIQRLPDAGWWDRHFVDVNGYFVIGSTRFSISAPPTPSVSMQSPFPPDDGIGGVIATGLSPTPNPINALISNNYSQMAVSYYDTNWNFSTTDYVNYESTSENNFWIKKLERISNLPPPFPVDSAVSVIVYEKESWDESESFALILFDGIYDSITYYNPLDMEMVPKIRLGSVGRDVFVTRDGVVAQDHSGAQRLYSWNGIKIAESRAHADENVVMDYGDKDSYYVFDPGSRRLYKAHFWWR